MPLSSQHFYEFGPFRVDVQERILFNAGEPLPLPPRVFDTLLVLVERSGHLVDKEELLKLIWPDTFVEENNLTQNVSALRKVLGEVAGGGQYIETIPRRGYRFTASVRADWDEETELVVAKHTRSQVITREVQETDVTELSTLGAAVDLETRAGRTRHRQGLLLMSAVLVCLLVGLAFGLYRYFEQRRARALASFQTLQLARLTDTGHAVDACISPDGRYVVYVLAEAGQQSLWVRQVATSSTVQLIAPSTDHFWSLSFAPDGNYFFFLKGAQGSPVNTLYRMALLGGEARKLLENVAGINSNITFAPDGQRLAYARRPDALGESALVVVNVDGSGERALAKQNLPRRFAEVAWAPDGERIACFIADISAGYSFHLAAVRVADGTEENISAQRWWTVGRFAWLHHGRGLAISAADRPYGMNQVWRVAYPGGEAQRITNDLAEYGNVSLTSDATVLVSLQSNQPINIWTMAADGSESSAKQITFGVGRNESNVTWTPGGQIVFNSRVSGNQEIRIIDADGSRLRQLTEDGGIDILPSVSPDGRYIVYQSYRTGAFSLWRMDIDGGNPIRLTDDNSHFPSCTPDGQWVLYHTLRTSGELWKVPLAGGSPIRLTEPHMSMTRPVPSPDGQLIACSYLAPQQASATAGAQFNLAVLPASGGEPSKIFDSVGPPAREFHWTPDGRAIAYVVTRNGVSNIWGQPLTGGPPEQLTNFHSDQIYSFAWSFDGKWLALTRGNVTSDVVLLSGLK